MPFGLGPTEVIIVLILALVVFGPKKLPEMARSVGKGIREFKSSVSMDDDDDDRRDHPATPPTGQTTTPAPSLPPAAPAQQEASPAETTGGGTQR